MLQNINCHFFILDVFHVLCFPKREVGNIIFSTIAKKLGCAEKEFL